ncbi:phosphopantetheine-binding protein, partial [Paucibacter sp. APW11]
VAARAYEAPQGEVEQTLAAIWGELLKLQRIGRRDNFFELGGSSLLATQVMLQMRKAFEIDMPLIQLFQTPVLSDLAELVVTAVVQRFESSDVEALSAELGDLSEDEIEALLQQERALAQQGRDADTRDTPTSNDASLNAK